MSEIPNALQDQSARPILSLMLQLNAIGRGRVGEGKMPNMQCRSMLHVTQRHSQTWKAKRNRSSHLTGGPSAAIGIKEMFEIFVNTFAAWLAWWPTTLSTSFPSAAARRWAKDTLEKSSLEISGSIIYKNVAIPFREV